MLRFFILMMIALGLSSGQAYSCALGFSYHFQKLPADVVVLTRGESALTNFMNDKFGVQKWRRSQGRFKFKALKPIENSLEIPLTFGSKIPQQKDAITFIELYQINFVNVVEFSKSKRGQEVDIKKMFPKSVPIASDSKIGPSKPDLIAVHADLSASFRLNRIAGKQLVSPMVSIRVKARPGARKFQAFAIFYPGDKARLPIIAKSDLMSLYGRCEFKYYVKGPWPKTLLPVYRYQ